MARRRSLRVLGAAAPRGEEQPLEALRPAALLVLEHALGVLGVGQGAEGEQHDGQARTRRCGPGGSWSGSARSRRSRSRPGWPLRPSSRSWSRRARRGPARSRCSSRVGIDDLLLECCRARPPMPAMAPDSANTTMRCQVGLTPRPAVAVSLPRMAARLRPDRPLAHQEDDDHRDDEHAHGEQEHGVAVEVEERAGAQPLRLDARCPAAPPVMEIVVEEGAVEEQGGGQGHQRQAQSAQAQREERPGPRRRRPPATAPTRPPTSMLRPRWLASWAAVKAPTPAKVAWHSESWPAMPVISVIESSTIERVRPLLKTVSQVTGYPGQHGHAEAGEEDPPQRSG